MDVILSQHTFVSSPACHHTLSNRKATHLDKLSQDGSVTATLKVQGPNSSYAQHGFPTEAAYRSRKYNVLEDCHIAVVSDSINHPPPLAISNIYKCHANLQTKIMIICRGKQWSSPTCFRVALYIRKVPQPRLYGNLKAHFQSPLNIIIAQG